MIDILLLPCKSIATSIMCIIWEFNGERTHAILRPEEIFDWTLRSIDVWIYADGIYIFCST